MHGVGVEGEVEVEVEAEVEGEANVYAWGEQQAVLRKLSALGYACFLGGGSHDTY